MSDKWISVGTTSGMLKHRSVNFDKAMLVHKITCGLPEFAAAHKAFADFGVDIHVDIAAAIALFLIGEAIVAWKRA